MKVIMKNDYFQIDTAREQALSRGREDEFKYIQSLVEKFHTVSNESVFYPKNMFEVGKGYKLFFFLENEVVIGESILNKEQKELATITKMKYINVKEVKLSYLDMTSQSTVLPNTLEITFDNGKSIVLDSVVDSKDKKVNSFINKIERIYLMLK
ncbi:DUF3908 family protein [Bacillus cereus]|uniref:YokE-like PH domain-containing protein n=1 Tax=Bacillus cereus HuA3-9 TaxID=1053205 RepID=R8CME6_BACCE|nr:DUF3908 family protein [Bacillus cereus]EOO12774.1 hypothetical protein IGA_04788 [Bacillus cereus HuA3-9]